MSNDQKNDKPINIPLKSDYASETELLSDIKDNSAAFTSLYKKYSADFKKIESLKNDLPTKFIVKDDFEDLMLIVQQGKMHSIDIFKVALGVREEIDIKVNYFESHLLIYHAGTSLGNLNFEKITDKLREAYVQTKKELAELKIILSRFESLISSLEKLYKALENAEINYRRFMEKTDKIKGLR